MENLKKFKVEDCLYLRKSENFKREIYFQKEREFKC